MKSGAKRERERKLGGGGRASAKSYQLNCSVHLPTREPERDCVCVTGNLGQQFERQVKVESEFGSLDGDVKILARV